MSDILKKKYKIDKLIVNSPFEEPQQYWAYDRTDRMFHLKSGRRPAGYIIASGSSKTFDDPGEFKSIELVNKIRQRVQEWKDNDYPGITGITRRLLEHWYAPEERKDMRFFFCQLEAIETIIWLTEAPESEKTGLEIPNDGGIFPRLCSKMATGTGKTVVMAMLIAWQVINKITYPQDKRFSKYVFIVAPGLTVKSRLKVLHPTDENNYYSKFNIIPPALTEKLNLGKIVVQNWHILQWETDEKIQKKKSVDKRGVKSDEAYVREVLGEIALAKNILVINDEAHHAWRVNPEVKVKNVGKDIVNEATIWVSGLDRIHRTRGILQCFDFTATPFAPSGKKSGEEALFPWIVSDFGLNDAIESGLVKTPRVVIRDDGKMDKDYKSRLYHIYMDRDVKDDLNRQADESEPLPDLVNNAYYLLGRDWLETKKSWEKIGIKVPPVLITVANRTETASRIKFSFDHNQILLSELCNPDKTLHIDSKVLKDAELKEGHIDLSEKLSNNDNGLKLTKNELAELLRKQVDTVGVQGEPGEQIQNVISVGMLSEGWDAKTVTHILGLRAFSSQLLCEQVVGRGLRRVSYELGEDGLYPSEYVNIFGVPFTFLPHEDGGDTPPPPPQPTTKIEVCRDKQEFELSWPNIVRIDRTYKPKLSIDLNKVAVLELDPYESITSAELGAIIEGKPSLMAMTEIDLKDISNKFRMQTIIFETSKRIFNSESPKWKGNTEFLLIQIIKIVETFINSGKIEIKLNLFHSDELRKRVLIILNMNKIVHHIWQAIKVENTSKITPIFNSDRPISSTRNMPDWYTRKAVQWTEKSHINYCALDSGWEGTEAYELDKNPNVKAWVKNDHLGFEILYNYQGVIRKYRPDFIIQLTNGLLVVLETKGQVTGESKAKEAALVEWTQAVNEHGGFGQWASALSVHPNDVSDIIHSFVSPP